MFKDVNGKISMKRIVGFCTAVVVWIVAIYAVVNNSQQAYNVLWPLVSLVGGVLGVSVLEKK